MLRVRPGQRALGQPATPLGEGAPSHFESYADGAAKSNSAGVRDNTAWGLDASRTQSDTGLLDDRP